MSEDVLIYVIDPSPASPALRVTLKAARQTSGGHLFIVPNDAIAMPDGTQTEGARVIRSRRDLAPIAATLSASDSLFASAWFSGKDASDRAGDGESWDAKGFECP
ncbi:hypothetical protein FQV27_11085 [Paracoccus aurantiacus]|uniref:Uncharacterized protein n=1 Tax=Paracoccus aurantiacus TaxID=2599412 RepID=A0A5C6S1R6_9RHOB|nr:hypothetical protein [Paracoccus aurantiacus]TXB68529.1 hypothetical protein FQV27_11085 [Paracoccus aurantiacus]